jgi:hypothetical protein
MPVRYHIVDSSTVDPVTGDKSIVTRVVNIKKAVVMPAREFRSFVYDLAFISANKDFTTGGYFDPEDKQIIIDAVDLKGHNPQIQDYIICDNGRYDIKEVQAYNNNEAYFCLGRKIRGQDVVQIVTRHSGILLEDSATYTLVDRLTRDVVDTLDLTQRLVEVP